MHFTMRIMHVTDTGVDKSGAGLYDECRMKSNKLRGGEESEKRSFDSK